MKIRDMRKALDSKEISAKELAQTYFERIKKYDDKVKSFITVTEEKALEQAEKAQGVIDKGEANARQDFYGRVRNGRLYADLRFCKDKESL